MRPKRKPKKTKKKKSKMPLVAEVYPAGISVYFDVESSDRKETVQLMLDSVVLRTRVGNIYVPANL